jgi:hypothetical protein
MTGPNRRFDPREMDGVDLPLDVDEVALIALARELEAVSAAETTPLPSDFDDRVMAALADEPPPRPVARGWSIAAIAATVGEAWRIATTGPRPAAIRLQALALVLLVAITALSLGSVAVVGAVRLFSNDATPTPSIPLPTPSASIPPPSPSLLPSPSGSPSPSATPTVEPTGTAEPTETAEPTGTDDDATKTPKPTDTERPTDTPDPEDTPEPTGTDDHSGPGGGESDDGGGNSGPGGG